MPGLPRKSTVKQFKKLMKKSGKAKTNKAAGATDPSARKIATYEQYCLMREGHELDPYGEEIWNDTTWKHPNDNALYNYNGEVLPRHEIRDRNKIRVSNFFKDNPDRDVYYIGGIMFWKKEFNLNERFHEAVKWYSKGKLIKSLEDDIIEDYDPVGIGDDFPTDPNDVKLDQVYTLRSDIGVKSNSYRVTDIDMENFSKITFVTNAGSRFIVPFNKVKDYDFVRIG